MRMVFETLTLPRCFRLIQTDSFHSEFGKLFIKWTQGQSDFVYEKAAYVWNWVIELWSFWKRDDEGMTGCWILASEVIEVLWIWATLSQMLDVELRE